MRHSRPFEEGWFNGLISNRLSPPHALQCHSNREQGGAMIGGLESIARGKDTTKRQKPIPSPSFLTGEDHFCKSDEEFEELTRVYMQDR